MALLACCNHSTADALIPGQGSKTIAACNAASAPDTPFAAVTFEIGLDAIIGGIALAALIGISRSLREGARVHLPNLCCKRNVASWPRKSASGAGRTGNKEEKLFLIDVFKAHAQKGDVDSMTKLLEEVEKSWLPCLNVQDYHCFVQCLAKGKDPVTAHLWLRRCVAAGLQPRHSTFNAVISSYIKKKEFERALQVADEMRFAGIDYDTATYNMVIDVSARQGDAHRAQSWMKKMLNEKIQPNIIGFSTVMRACAEAGLLEDLDMWFETSQSYGFPLDLLGFRSVLRVFSKKEDAANVAKWLDLMIEKGVQPGVIDCMEAFKPILKHGDVGLAIRLMDQVHVAGVQPPAFVVGECIVKAVERGHHEKAKTWAYECAARRVGIGEAAKKAMVDAGLTLPVCDWGNRENSSSHLVDARAQVGATSLSFEADVAARRASIGSHYIGVIKESNPYQYGFITCAATYQLFKQDVWFSQDENKEGLTKGQRVLFRLRMDDKGRPRACDMKLSR